MLKIGHLGIVVQETISLLLLVILLFVQSFSPINFLSNNFSGTIIPILKKISVDSTVK